MTSVRFGITSGVARPVVVPSPNCPDVLSPQHATVPFDFNTHANHCPAMIWVAPVNPITCTGRVLFVVVPSPNCFLLLRPQHQTVPSVLTPHVNESPAATREKPVIGAAFARCGVCKATGSTATITPTMRIATWQRKRAFNREYAVTAIYAHCMRIKRMRCAKALNLYGQFSRCLPRLLSPLPDVSGVSFFRQAFGVGAARLKWATRSQ